MHSGIGPAFGFGDDFSPISSPTVPVGDRLTLRPEPGIVLELVHAPGESPDQLAVWWEEEGALFPADNVYKAFPNLYAIRGEKR